MAINSGDFNRLNQEVTKRLIRDKRIACLVRANQRATKSLKDTLTSVPNIVPTATEAQNDLVEEARRRVDKIASTATVFIFPGGRRPKSPGGPEGIQTDVPVVDLDKWRQQREWQLGDYGYEYSKENMSAIIDKLTGQPVELDTYHQFICEEAIIGGLMFGALQSDQQRYFFCLDDRTWVWHEQGPKPDFRLTTKYSFDLNGVTKTVNDGKTWQNLSPNETNNLLIAIERYHEEIVNENYNQPA